jgi:selenocysteine-specific elongation factor
VSSQRNTGKPNAGQRLPEQAKSATARSVVLGTAGHIDHGKTALVLALTGTDTDRLPEEKARGITIDLGFAALDLIGPDGQRFDVSLIDVPGHHAFLRNMLAGTGGIDAVMLVVAADEGVKAQTVEHLQICRLLGIARGLVVLTKRDAVGAERLAEVRAEVAGLVEGTFLEGAPVLAVSALRREGIAELKAALTRLVATVPERGADRVARLPVDRVFSVRGFGTVVTGTLQAGVVRAGETLRLEPVGRGVRVRGVQVHGKARVEAAAPNRVALNVAGVEVGEVERGNVVVPEGTLEPVRVVDAEVEGLAGAAGLRHRQRVRVHAFASESLATVLLYAPDEGQAVEGGQRRALVRLRLARPMVLAPGDRFVVRQPSPAVTWGGGVVVDAHPLPRVRKTAALSWLREVQGAAAAEQVLLRVKRRGVSGLSLGGLVAETGYTAEALRRLVGPLLAAGRVVAGGSGDHFVDSGVLAGVETAIRKEVARAAEGRAARAELRARVRAEEWVFALAVQRLQASRQVVAQGEVLALPGQITSAGKAELSGRVREVDELYRAAGLASPIVSEAAERLRMGQPELRATITSLLRAGRLVRMGSDALLVHADALARLTGELRAKHRGRSFDVGWFKALTGLSRKHAIPLLEYLDGVRVTRKTGEMRVVV